MAIPALDRPTRPVGPGFAAAYALAQIGAFISFIPLLQVLAPLKAEAIDPLHKTVTLSTVLLYGAIVAGVSNLVAGAVSDRTRSRFGRRKPWLVVGLVGSLAGYWLIWQAKTPLMLTLGVCFFQLFFNFLFAALNAILPDQVPDRQKGRFAAAAALGLPVGTVAGMALVGKVFDTEASRFIGLAVVVTIALLPLILLLKDRRLEPDEAPRAPLNWRSLAGTLWLFLRTRRDFAFAWCGRFLVILAHSMIQGYFLFYLQDAVRYPHLFPGHRAEEGLATLTAVQCVTSVAAAFASGWLSDRLGRRKIFVTAGALVLAAGSIGFTFAPTWGAVIGAYLVYGVGTGCFYTLDMALIAQVLPRVRDAGKDLGVINLSNTLPQAISPMLAVLVLNGLHADYRALFLAASVICGVGGLLIQPIRGVR
jgi:MFS family permease